MYGQTPGEALYGSEAPYWRAIVEATTDASAPDETVGVGNPMVQGIAAGDGGGDVAPAPVAITTSAPDATAAHAATLTSAVVIESSTDFSAPGDVAPTTAVLIESSGAMVQDGNADGAAVAIGSASSSVATQDGDLAALAVGIASSGATVLSAMVSPSLAMAAGEAPPLYERHQPEMLPLALSHEADDLETELKQLFMEMFETHIRADERYVNVLGMPQHGPRELIEDSLANDGLSIYRGADVASGAGSYLLRAWRSHNPKRGLHLLKTYLQLLWPNVWKAEQMWQDKAEPYPTALAPTDEGNHFLTSRVNVALPSRVTSGGDLNAIQSGLRASLPARIVMQLAIESEDNFGIGIATAYHPGFVAQSYVGTVS